MIDEPRQPADDVRREHEDNVLNSTIMGNVGRWLPTKQAILEATISASAPDAYAAAEAVLGHLARRNNFDAVPKEDGGGDMVGMFGSGWANMNATVVEIRVDPHGATRSDLWIRGAAKEGLLNQHSSEKAVRRVRDALSKKLGGVEIPAEPVPRDT